jgi:hypothetical protein
MRNATLNQFCVWLEDTPVSQAIQVSEWIVPITQIIHIFAVSAVLSVALMIALRLLGYFATEQPFSSTFSKCWPILKFSLFLLLMTGILLIIGEPSRSLANIAFQIKMILLITTLFTLRIIKRILVNPVTDWKSGYESERVLQLKGKFLAVGLLILLTCIVVAGRWIAYT